MSDSRIQEFKNSEVEPQLHKFGALGRQQEIQRRCESIKATSLSLQPQALILTS